MLISMRFSRASEMMSQARMRTNTTIKLLGEHSLIECPLPKGKRVRFGVRLPASYGNDRACLSLGFQYTRGAEGG